MVERAAIEIDEIEAKTLLLHEKRGKGGVNFNDDCGVEFRLMRGHKTYLAKDHRVFEAYNSLMDKGLTYPRGNKTYITRRGILIATVIKNAELYKPLYANL